MNSPQQTYKLLSDGVEAIRIGHKAAKKRADAQAKGSAQAREAGRREYIQTLQSLQDEAVAVLEATSEDDRKEMFATQFGARKLRHCI